MFQHEDMHIVGLGRTDPRSDRGVTGEAGVREGLNRQDALLLAGQTMLGTAKLLIEKGTDPQDLIRSVTSAKGTTAAGLAKEKLFTEMSNTAAEITLRPLLNEYLAPNSFCLPSRNVKAVPGVPSKAVGAALLLAE